MRVARLAALVVCGLIVMMSSRARGDDPLPSPPPPDSPPPSPLPPDSPPAAPGNTPATPTPTEKSFEEPGPSPEKAAPWLRQWLPPTAPDPNPILADGNEVSVQAGFGALISKFSSTPLMVVATAEYGRFLKSSKRQAFGVEAVGKINLVFDHVTPQFGMIGAGVRRVGRRSGTGFGSVDYERLSAGPAFMSRGSNLDVGLGAELALGVLTFKGIGLGVFVDGYFFEPSEMLGPNTVVVVGLGYVQSAITGLRASVAREEPVRRETQISDHPCPYLEKYQEDLAESRKNAVQVCNQGDAQACEVARANVLSLNDALTACEQGKTIVPPRAETNDAPVP